MSLLPTNNSLYCSIVQMITHKWFSLEMNQVNVPKHLQEKVTSHERKLSEIKLTIES